MDDLNFNRNKRYVDDSGLVRACWLLLPPYLLFAACVFWLREFPLWTFIVEAVFLTAFLMIITIICLKQKLYQRMVKIYLYVIFSAITLYLMHNLPGLSSAH